MQKLAAHKPATPDPAEQMPPSRGPESFAAPRAKRHAPDRSLDRAASAGGVLDDRLGVHTESRRGRGSVSNAAGRFEPETRHLTDDGWGTYDLRPAPIRTTVVIDASRTILARNHSPDIGFDRSINPYRGCEHGCVYCYARPTHAFLGLSPGLDFETRLFAKPDAAKLLAQELRRPGYRCAPIAFGTNTDPYQPIERDWRIMRQLLEVLSAANHPLTIVTKSALIARDIDILADLAKRNLVQVLLSVTTLDRRLARRMEPRAAAPERRIETLAALSAAGIPTGVMVAPLIPGLTDHEMESILRRARAAGAEHAGYILVRLPLEIKELWREWLAENYPDRAEKVMALIRDSRGGRDYDPSFGQRMKGTGPFADLLAARFRLATRKLGFKDEHRELDTRQFRPQGALGQLSML